MYATLRLGDCISTALCFEKYGYYISKERNPVARFFMEHLGVHGGNVVHELAGGIIMLAFYKSFPREIRNVIPYGVGLASIPLVIYNLQEYFR